MICLQHLPSRSCRWNSWLLIPYVSDRSISNQVQWLCLHFCIFLFSLRFSVFMLCYLLSLTPHCLSLTVISRLSTPLYPDEVFSSKGTTSILSSPTLTLKLVPFQPHWPWPPTLCPEGSQASRLRVSNSGTNPRLTGWTAGGSISSPLNMTNMS